jgi:hypothetical protein
MDPHPGAPTQAGWIGYLLGFAIFALVITLRMRRMAREQPLQIDRLWIVPDVYLLIATLLYWRYPPTGINILWCLLGLGAGAVLGWQRGKLMRIVVDPETHAIR